MAKGDIEYIRAHKNRHARIGKMVTYAGHPYRIASANGTNLVLKSILLVHPQDDQLDYQPPLSTVESSNQREITRLKCMLYEMTSRADWVKAGYQPESYDTLVKEIEG